MEKKTLTINKSLQHLKGEIYVTDPKKQKSNRVIDLPDFLCDEMEDYFSMLYKCEDDTRLFNVSKSILLDVDAFLEAAQYPVVNMAVLILMSFVSSKLAKPIIVIYRLHIISEQDISYVKS